MYFAESVLKTDNKEAFVILRIRPGTTIKKIGLHNEVGGSRTYAGTVTIHRGIDSTIACTPSYTLGNKTTPNPIEFGEGNLLWATDNLNSMNSVGLQSATISATGDYDWLPSPGAIVSIPINVSALTDLNTDAAHAYTGAAGKYEIYKDVYAKVKSIKYTGDKDYGDSVYFSEKDGDLYLDVKESIYGEIGTAAQLTLPLVAEVEQTLTGDTVTTPECVVELSRPYVFGKIEGEYIRGEWNDNSGLYKISKTATLMPFYGYELPDAITVKAGDKVLTASTDYEYDKITGKVKINAAAVTDDILITATAEKAAMPLEFDINEVLPSFNEDTWYNESNSTLDTRNQYWTVSINRNEGFSNSITLDGDGSLLTKRLYIIFGYYPDVLYYYDLTYKRDTAAPAIENIGDVPEDTYPSAEIGFTVSDPLSGVNSDSVKVACNDGKTLFLTGTASRPTATEPTPSL